MGYCMTQRGESFLLKKENQEGAFLAVQELGKTNRDFHWVKAEDFKNMVDIFSTLEEWRWEPEMDDNGNIVSLSFTGEKLGADQAMFSAIAPFVEPESFIEMEGEDGSLWRWVFDGTGCQEITPTVTW